MPTMNGAKPMSKLLSILSLFLVLGLTAAVDAAPPAEADGSVLLESIRANRRALVAVNLQLTAEQAAAFWPLYDRYQQDLNASGDRLKVLIDDYIAHFRDLSNEKAMQLIEEYLATEGERLKVRRSYLPEFAKILPGRTVARFYQIENKMDAVIRYDLAATIPVVDEAGAAAK